MLVTTIAPRSDHVVRLKLLSVGNQANIATGARVVVCDDGKEVILENSGWPAALKLDTKEVHEHANTPTHQKGIDQPGRCINLSATRAPRSSRPIGTMKRRGFCRFSGPPARHSDCGGRDQRSHHHRRAAQRALGMLSRNRFGRLVAAHRTKCYGACTDARIPAACRQCCYRNCWSIPRSTRAVGVGKCLPELVESTDGCARPTRG